jgi:Ca-activated chloride channel family protein
MGCRPEPSRERTPVNVSLVIDRSGSMAGERLEQARAAAIMAVNRLGPDDIASVVTFDHLAQRLVGAQQVTDRTLFIDRIRHIAVGGSTAIHDGVGLGASEVGRFKDPRRLNRVVLISDGQANVGPRRPDEFAALGARLLAEGISVTTIGLGLGYNEDLMLELARASDGNHAFARDPSDLIHIFNKEFDDVLASCAQTVSIDLEFSRGVRVVRALSRDGSIDGQRAQFRLNQIYAATEHYLLLELEVDQAVTAVGERELGVVKVGYLVPNSQNRQLVDTTIRARFSASEDEVKAAGDWRVAEAVVEQLARQRAQQAIRLKDSGHAAQARQLLEANAAELKTFLATAPAASGRLRELYEQYRVLAAPAAPSAGKLTSERKILRALELPGAGAASRY